MNIFGGTKYRYAEEDRLTNALLSALENSEMIVSCIRKQRPLSFPSPYLEEQSPSAVVKFNG
jgi:hypothetical protein